MSIAFRADGGAFGLGLGHVMRCIAIGEALKRSKVDCWFICKNYPAAEHVILSRGFDVRLIPENSSFDDDVALTLSNAASAKWIVVDSYLHSEEYLSALCNGDKRVAFLDDQSDSRMPVDLIFGNIYCNAEQYENKILPFTKVFAGPPYTPLRHEFANLSPHHINNEIRNLLIMCGGEDALNATERLLGTLVDSDIPFNISIVIGAAYRYADTLRAYLQNYPHPTRIYQDQLHIAPLFQQSDLVISAGGTTVFEIAAAGTPMVIVKVADNQSAIAQYLRENGLAEVIDSLEEITADMVLGAIARLQDPQVRRERSLREQALIDGKGADRIAGILTSQVDEISLREVTSDPQGMDSKLIWTWRNDIQTRKMSRSQDPISWETHQEWYKKVVAESSSVVLLMGMKDDESVGMVRFDRCEEGQTEININVDPEKRGKGLGKSVLLAACSYAFIQLKLRRVIAFVKRDNLASLKIFDDAGFGLVKDTGEYLCLALIFSKTD